ncbi:MAG: type II toxin-antitoxin system HicA family toxin [Myxococcales bacterium]|nr:type II toxin-antitoxin system HicA family toxin [Myxococcales bacterium]
MKRRELEAHLRRHGCLLVREGSSHTVFENAANRRRCPVPRHREIPDPLVLVICRQLDIPRPA